ncbi:hypothetical protein NLU13_5759 [Sarocladium strictum]|uniref:Uncharacterized protein n=1 Tax=Sarocladium strictum TaxID=5046 RepID=A0AA39GK22_SARSR|nr:hypothetical protein NLU13_5759 [Sarocladium strictum]
MLAGGLAQMTSNNFGPGLGMPTGGLASRRGGQNIKPLSFDSINKQGTQNDTGIPTPRTARGHLLAGLRTAPKTSTATSFGPMSPTMANPQQQFARNNGMSVNGNGVESSYNPPKTAFPQYNNQTYNNVPDQQYTVDQVLAPPELPLDEQAQEYMEPQLYEQLVATNMYLAQQQQRLQQQLRSVQAAAQQFQQLNLSNPQLNQQQMMLYQQQQQLRNLQQQLGIQAAMSQGQQVYYHAATGQYLVDSSGMGLASSYGAEQQFALQQQQQQMYLHQMQQNMPRVQVSPPPENQPQAPTYRSNSPPKRYDSPQTEVTPLPPPSANAFRRGHKKSASLAPVDSALAASIGSDGPKSAGPKTANFPLTPATGTYGPGQARAGEHPIRQPRGPPSLDELKAKPTAKHEGSKNFAARTRRSALSNLMRAGNIRRKGTSSSAGSMSPVSETAEESATPITDNDSDSGRSGSGSLDGEMECGDSQTSASGSWGAIGSDRPSSRQKTTRGSIDSAVGENESNSFADVFKNGAARAAKEQEQTGAQRKAPRLVLTSVEKRKTTLN